MTLPEKTKQVSCSPITSRKSSPSWLLSGHLPHVKHGLLEIRPQELRKPSEHASRKRKLVRTFSVLSCGTFRHEDSHSPSECVGECTHAWNWAPTAFSLRDDVSCRHRSNRQPPHCNSCFLTVGSLSAFASINANCVAAKHTYERGISRRRREYAEIACAQRSHLYEILDQGALGSHRQRLAHLHLS